MDYNATVENEDIPAGILLSMSGIQFLSEAHIQPLTDKPDSIETAIRKLRAVARTSEGVLEDLQTGEVYLPSGIKKELSYSETKDETSISVSWFIDPSTCLADQYTRLVEAFEQYLPQALPRRYGTYEPPQYKYAETGKSHLIEFLTKEWPVVWYATKPVKHVFILDTHNQDGGPLGFRCNRVEMTLLESAYREPNWNYGVKRLFKEVARILQPFYGEIIRENEAQTFSWWWRGLPPGMGNPIVIGKPYAERLKGLVDRGEKLGDDMYYLEFEDQPAAEAIRRLNKNLFARKKGGGLFRKETLAVAGNYDYAKEFPFKT
jgi:hypothetical protein